MDEQAYRELQRRADRICSLILMADYPEVEIVMERHRLRNEVASRFPDRLELYDLIYENRFERLWEQFR